MCNSYITKPIFPNPTNCGWHASNKGTLASVLFLKDIAPIELRTLTHLSCTDTHGRCQGLSGWVRCIKASHCLAECSNILALTAADNNMVH